MGREVAGMFKSEGTDVHLWLIYVDVRQKSNQYCDAIINQLKITKYIKKKPKFLKKKKETSSRV